MNTLTGSTEFPWIAVDDSLNRGKTFSNGWPRHLCHCGGFRPEIAG
jgi:hypothetical protein